MKIIHFLSVVLFLTSCTIGDVEFYRSPDSDINIYLVKEGQLEFHESEIELNSLQLEENPWVKDSDIGFYDWSSHSFFLNKEVEKSIHSGKHFVVTSGKKRLFIGVFWPMYMSSIPMIPAISPEDEWFSPKDVVRFGQFGITRPGELDENTELKKELKAAGIFREGIKVELTNIKKSGSTSISYTFKITNRDLENIYLLDPKKMGDARFHYYTNGVSLQKDDKYYWPSDFETKASDNIKSNWYQKLLPGNSMTRTVTIAGFNSLPSGKVKATFRFPGAHNLKAGEWKKPNGRIWLGDYIAEAELSLR